MYATIDWQCLGMVPWDGRVRKNKTETGLSFLGNFSLNVFPGNPLLCRDKYVEPRSAWDVTTSRCPVASLFGSSTTSTPLEALPTPLPQEPPPKILEVPQNARVCCHNRFIALLSNTSRTFGSSRPGQWPQPLGPWHRRPRGCFVTAPRSPPAASQRELGLCGAVPSAVSSWVTFRFVRVPPGQRSRLVRGASAPSRDSSPCRDRLHAAASERRDRAEGDLRWGGLLRAALVLARPWISRTPGGHFNVSQRV